MYNKKTFQNKAFTIEQQLELLLSQGLLIPNKEQAKFHLSTVNYHRLSAYFSIFYDLTLGMERHFKLNTHFEEVWDLYVFDRKLRVLTADALERIEIAFRTNLINFMSVKYGPHWYLEESIFKNKVIHSNFLKMVQGICDNSHELAIHQYNEKYFSPKYPPIWVLMESLSFGACSKLYKNIKLIDDKRESALIFGYHPTLIDSWMNALTYTRNICAHHARLWNRWFVQEPKDIFVFNERMKNRKPFYQHICIIKKLLKTISPGNHWVRALYVLISEYKHFPVWKMGFIDDWENDPFWKDL